MKLRYYELWGIVALIGLASVLLVAPGQHPQREAMQSIAKDMVQPRRAFGP